MKNVSSWLFIRYIAKSSKYSYVFRFGMICLKAHNHLLAKYINLSKFEPLKPSRSGDISLLIFKISKEAVKKPCLDPKIQCLFSEILILPVYNFDIKFSGLSPIYPNVTLKS